MIDAALFLLLGALEVRYATSQIAAYGGLAAKVPRLATFFVIASLAMIGLPLLNGFVGEFLILSSTFTGVSRGWAVAATVGVILGAAYMLWLVQRLFYGPESKLAVSEAGGRSATSASWPCWAAGRPDAGDGRGADVLAQHDRNWRPSAASHNASNALPSIRCCPDSSRTGRPSGESPVPDQSTAFSPKSSSPSPACSSC